MKKLIVLLALTCLTSSMAFAINDSGENSLGVYFDLGTFNVNCLDVAASVPANMYFVMANCTEPTLAGFEFGWAFDPDPVGQYFVLASILPPESLNIGTDQNLIVGIGSPIPTDAATVLVEFQLLFLAAPIMADITVGPSVPASIPGESAFVSGDQVLMPMNYSTFDGEFVIRDSQGWVRPGVGTLGCPAPIAVEEASWGSVKALYQ
jgi:hypothetical protein